MAEENSQFIQQWRAKLVNGKLQIQDMDDLKNLKGIGQVGMVTELIITGCKNMQLTGIEELQFITTLKASGCNLVDLTPLHTQASQQLVSLDLSNNLIEKIEPIEILINLKDLDISGNKIRETAELFYITRMESLRTLKLTGNECITVADFENRLLYSVAQNVEFIQYKTQGNDLDEIKGRMEAVKESLSPYEIEQLKKEIAKIEQENADMQKEIEKYEAENVELDKLEVRLVKGIEEIKTLVLQNFVDWDPIQ